MSDYGINIGSRRSRNVITPTFSRDFIANNTLNHGVGPNITFTRASSATFFTSTGILSTVPNNVPRFDHGNFRTNLTTFSEDFTSWSNLNLSVVTGATDPNNTTTADQLIENTVPSVFHVTSKSITIPQPGLYTYSVYLKPAGRSAAFVELYNHPTTLGPFGSGTRFSYFNLTGNGSVFSTIGNATPSIQLVNNGWYRCSITAQASSIGNTTTNVGLASSNSVTYAGSYTGNGSSGLYIWGAQVEYGLSATNYIPTTTSAVTTGVPLGLLIEEPRTNLYQRSEEFDNEYWTKARATITTPNALLSPAGTTTADLLVEDNTANNSHVVFRQVSYTGYGANGPVTATIFAKAKERTRLSLVVGYGTTTPVNLSFGEVVFNLIDGTAGSFVGFTAGTAGPGTGSGTIIPAGNGWYRCSITVTPSNVTATEIQLYVALHNGTSTSYTGDGTSGLYIWGAQLEVDSFPTSYIPTTTLSAIRQGDVALVNPVTSFVNQSQGTLFSEFRTGAGFPVAGAFVLDADAIGDRVGIFASGATQIAINNVFTGIASFSPFTNTIFKATLGYKAFNHASSIDGKPIQSNTAIGVPINLSYLRIGCEGSLGYNGAQLSGHVRKVTYWPTKLSNNRLRLITS